MKLRDLGNNDKGLRMEDSKMMTSNWSKLVIGFREVIVCVGEYICKASNKVLGRQNHFLFEM